MLKSFRRRRDPSARQQEAGAETGPQTPILLVHVGDLHIGSTVALCPPVVELDDGGQRTASAEQVWYWECWQRFWEDTANLARTYGATVRAVMGGDLREGDHHRTTQIWAKVLHDQDRAVYQALEVAEEIVDEWVFVRGTPAHDGPASAAEERYARTLAERGWNVIMNGPRFSWWTYTAVVNGVKVQVKHEPGTKSWVPHTRDGAATRQAFYSWLDYKKKRVEPPDLEIFHHVHYLAGPGSFDSLVCYFMPGWQLPTNWVVRKTHSPNPEPPGGLRVLCQDGGWRPFPKEYLPESSVAWA